jgi:hypothetical protein
MAKKKFIKKHLSKQQKMQTEPFIEDLNKCSNTELIWILNWYAYNITSKSDQKKWIKTYLKNNSEKDLEKKISKIDEKYIYNPLSTLCRLENRGSILTEQNKEYIKDSVNKAYDLYLEREKNTHSKPDNVKVNKNKPTVQERMYEQAKVAMAEVDWFVDEILRGNEHKIDEVISGFGKPQINYVNNHIQSYIDDFKNNPEDHGLRVRKKNKIIRYLESLIITCDKYIQAKKKTQKIRTPKKKSPVQLCKNVKISENTKTPPTKIINSTYTLLYNEKYNRLNFLVAADGDGLTVTGTTVQNVSETKSKVYTIKDKKVLDNLPDSITKLKKYLENPEFKESKTKPTGRMSDRVNILKAI